MKARIALAILAVVAFAYQAAYCWDLAQQALFGKGVLRASFELQPGGPVVSDAWGPAAAAGLMPGDEILTINGQVFDGLNDLRRAIAAEQPVRVQWRRAAATRTATIDLEAIPRTQPSATGALVTVVTGILTPFICLAIGFGVAAIRPRDRNAWILLLLMLSFSQLAAIGENPVGASLPLPLAALGAGWRPLWASLWGMSMALFGIFFPNRLPWDRKHPWFKWAVIAPFVLFAAGSFLVVVSRAERFGLLPWLTAVEPTYKSTIFWLNAAGVSIFFAAFGFRRSTEKNPDVKRRLNLIWWGALVSLVPIFLLLLTGFAVHRNPFSDFPVWVDVPVLLALFLFPLSLAYVIVVHRAMDVRVVVRQGLQYALARRGLIALRVVVILIALWYASLIVLDPASSRPRRVGAIALVMAVALWSQVAAEKLFVWIDRRFFREAVDMERVLTELGESVRSVVETQPLLERVSRVISQTLHVDHVAMLLESRGDMEPAYAIGTDARMDGFAAIAAAIRERRVPIRIDDGEKLALPLTTKDKLIGIMLLGPKKSEEPYSRSDIRLLENVAGQTGLAIENSQLTALVAREVAQRERLNRELEIAREVQQRLFPQNRPQIHGLDYAGRCRPAQSVGGDYFDFIELPRGGLGIAIGDVSGKGIPAALLMASLQACLRGQTIDGTADLAKLMVNVNRLIYEASPANRYATFFYSQYSAATRELTYVNAGHNLPIILREDEVLQLGEGGPAVGLFQTADYRQGQLLIQAGDVFIGFTDGVSEAMNREDEEWGEDRLTEAAQHSKFESADGMIDALLRGADTFAAGAPQHDDMTLIVAKFRKV